MNYYLIEVTTMKDGTESQAIWVKDSLDSAIMDFHSSLASAMANENVKHAMRMVIDVNGMTMRQENWNVQEPVPEPNDEPKD